MPRPITLPSFLRILLLCLLGCAVLFGAARLSTRALDASSAHLQQLQTRQAPSAMALRELRAHLAELRLYELSMVTATGDTEEIADLGRRTERVLQGLHKQVAIYAATAPTGEEASRFADIQTKLAAYLRLHRQLSDAVHAGDRDRASQLSLQQAMPLRRALSADLVDLGRINAAQAQQPDAIAPSYVAH